MDEDERRDRVYWNKEVASLLKVGDSTIRRWCLLMEEAGYVFIKDANGSRGFSDHEVILLRRIRDLMKIKGFPLEKAITAVLEGVHKTPEPAQTRVVQSFTDGQTDLVQQTINGKLDELIEMNKKLFEVVQSQQQQIQALQARDEALVKLMNEFQQKNLELETMQEEQQKTPWWKFW